MEHCNFLPFPDICHLSCIFLAEQDIKITFSLGPKIAWYKINTVCISAASSPEPLSAALLTPRSHCSFYRTRWFPGGFIMRVFKRGSLIFLPLVGVLLVRPGHEKGKSFFQSLAVHRECVVWTLFYLKKKKKSENRPNAGPVLMTPEASAESSAERLRQYSAQKQRSRHSDTHRGIDSAGSHASLSRPKADGVPVGK